MRPEVGWRYLIVGALAWASMVTLLTSDRGAGLDIPFWERMTLDFAFGIVAGRQLRAKGW